MKPRFMNSVLVTCLLCTVDASAAAHERRFRHNDYEKPREECQVDPGEGGDYEREEVLNRCKGILIPPPTGDAEMVEPAPDIGTTPVIPPGFLPDHPPGPDYP